MIRLEESRHTGRSVWPGKVKEELLDEKGRTLNTQNF